jgi:DNA mismatch repair protein MutS
MIRQYREIKEKNQDKILLFRVGDFYEMFFDDAKTGARELEITLTSRETGKDNHVPLAGFPYHALNTYLGRLIERGYKVAICEQTEDPKLAKGIVKREIVQVITPGTVTDAAFLDEKSNNYLVSVYLGRGSYGIAAVDVSTGEFAITQARGKQAAKFLADEICRLRPAEIIINAGAEEDAVFLDALARLGAKVSLNPYREKSFAHRQAQDALLSQFGVSSLEALGCADLTFAVAAAGAAVAYLHENRPGGLTHLHKPSVYDPEGYMVLDAATRRNLELTRTIREERKFGSLLWVLDKTRTALGGRLLTRWLEQPLLDVQSIESRHDAVLEISADFALLEDLCVLLEDVYDLERLLGRVHCDSANARDLVALKNTLGILPPLKAKIADGGPRMQRLALRMPDLSELTGYLASALTDDPPLTIREGGLLRDGFHPELDKLRHACRNGRDYILGIEQRERERTGIKTLKVGYNRVFGYYLEISRLHAHLAPEDYIRKQTLANAERYITPELKEYESMVLGAEEKICALEYDVFLEVRRRVADFTVQIQEAAAALAELDVFQSLARVARDNRYVRPQVDNSDRIQITDGRHPVVERVLKDDLFVPNDTVLNRDEQRLLMITGPNMAGKSTYMRQTALIVLMAQIGSFVPAREAKIGVVDRIFTRIGAADDLVGGQSTFMVEMSEVANILSRATDKSLVLLDEVGRGTSTFDGISIARAVVEHLYKKTGARTLFATHYHELTDMAAEFPAVVNMATAVKERGEDIVFLHKVIPGSVDHSYGIQVARLAGLPPKVIERSKTILLGLEAPSYAVRETASAVAQEQMRLFMPEPELASAIDEVEETDLMTTTPLEAMQLLFRLQQALKKGSNNG